MAQDIRSAKVTEVRLHHALQTMTKVIDHYGDTYWPIFDALKNELDRLKLKRERLAQFRAPSNLRPDQSHIIARRSNVTRITEHSR